MSFVNKVGLQLYSVKDEAGKDFLATLEKVAAMGYKNVEFAGFFNTPKEVLKDTLDRLSLTPVSSHVGKDLLRSDLDNLIAYHKTIGAKYITLSWSKTDTLDEIKDTAELLNNVAPRIGDAGLELAYHNHDQEFKKIDGKYAIDILLELTEKSGVSPQFDVFWIQFAGLNPIDFIIKYGPRCKMIHLKDMKTAGERQNTEIGNGVIDIEKIIQKGLEVGAGYFIVEQESFDKPPMEACKISFNNLKAMAEQMKI
ncbi:MAG: sugar phosphate isomerase/epimerase [Clostridiaceae bacterium]|nr:sugar phosphate isomerase/epimerase [Clostridiaceae bacterium]